MSANLVHAARRALLDLIYEDDGQWFAGQPARNVTTTVAPLLSLLGLPTSYPPNRSELEQAELLSLDHSPLYPPRTSHLGEQVYAATWKATMAESEGDGAPIERVLRNLSGPIRQRHASVLATVATWFGAACGYAMLQHAKRLGATVDTYARSYLLAWTMENQRHPGKNHGYRTVEFLLAPRELLDTSPYGRGLKCIPDLSVEDLETIEHFMLWLAEGEGQKFLRRCAEVEAEAKGDDALKRHAHRILADGLAGAAP